MKEITAENVIDYIKQKGRHGKVTTEYLLENADVIKAIKTPIGKEILKYLALEYEELFQKIVELKHTPEDAIRFKVTKDIILRLSLKISSYERRLDEISAVAQKKGD